MTFPRRTLLLGLIPLVALGACASAQAAKPAVCDGKHRRPINIHGSVLGDVPPSAATAGQPARNPTPASTQAAPQPKPQKVSAADPSGRSFPSC
jgi:hypothetical protein